MRNSVSCRPYHCCSCKILQDKKKIIKDFHFYHKADEMKKKSVFETANFFFSEREDMTVDVDIRYEGRSKNIIAVD